MKTQNISNERKRRPKRFIPGAVVSPVIEYAVAPVSPPLRPNAVMPVSEHRRAWRCLVEVCEMCGNREGAYDLINSVRETLKAWLKHEHPDLPACEFDEIYRPTLPEATPYPTPGLGECLCSDLREFKRILRTHYPSSSTLDDVMNKVDRAIDSLESWTMNNMLGSPHPGEERDW